MSHSHAPADLGRRPAAASYHLSAHSGGRRGGHTCFLMSQQRPGTEEEPGEPFAPAFLLCYTSKALKHKIEHLLWPGESGAYGTRSGPSKQGWVQAGMRGWWRMVLTGASRLRAKTGPSVSTASVLVTAAAPQLGTQGHGAVGPATSQLLSWSPAPLGSPTLCRGQAGMWEARRAGMKGVAACPEPGQER